MIASRKTSRITIEFTVGYMFGYAFAMIVISGILAFWYSRASQDLKAVITFGSSLFGAMIALLALLYTAQNIREATEEKKRAAAARFAERWNDVAFTDRRKDVGTVIRGEKKLTDIDSTSITTVLNFFEEMSISVQTGQAEEQMLQNFFKSPLIQSAAVLKPWIEERQKKQPTVFREYLKVVDRWKDS